MEVTTKLKQRDINIDIAKTLAIIAVIFLHFFSRIGVLGATADNNTIWFEVLLRQTMSFCVPIFIMVTGYLMHKKTLSKHYYSKIFGVLFIYLITCAAYWIFMAASGDHISITKIVRGIIGIGDGSLYGWYVEMYIGLFLLIPFINLIWNGLTTKRSRQILCLTLILLSTLPRIVLKDIHLPDFWLALWPLMYYFIGAYLKTYPPKIRNEFRVIFLIVSWGILCTAAILQINHNSGIIPGTANFSNFVGGLSMSNTNLLDWSYPWIALYSVVIFVVILGIKIQFPKTISALIVKISSLTLGIYLVSSIFDIALYNNILQLPPTPEANLYYIYIAVPAVFIASFVSAIAIDALSKIVLKQVAHIGRPKPQRL